MLEKLAEAYFDLNVKRFLLLSLLSLAFLTLAPPVDLAFFQPSRISARLEATQKSLSTATSTEKAFLLLEERKLIRLMADQPLTTVEIARTVLAEDCWSHFGWKFLAGILVFWAALPFLYFVSWDDPKEKRPAMLIVAVFGLVSGALSMAIPSLHVLFVNFALSPLISIAALLKLYQAGQEQLEKEQLKRRGVRIRLASEQLEQMRIKKQ